MEPVTITQQRCKYCDKAFPPKGNKMYCSKRCKGKAHNPTPSPLIPPLTTGTTGAISELIVCSNLMLQGFHVFRAQSPSCPCDLIAMKNDLLYRVEVTSVRRRSTGVFYHNKKNGNYILDSLK